MPVDVIVVTPGKSLLCGGYNNDENVELKFNSLIKDEDVNDVNDDDDMLKNGPFTITTSSSSSSFQKTKKDHRKTLADIIEEEETDSSSDDDDVVERFHWTTIKKKKKKKKFGQKMKLFQKSKYTNNVYNNNKNSNSSDCGSDNSSTTSSTYASTILSSSSSSSSEWSNGSHSLGQRLLRRIQSSQQEQEQEEQQEKTAEGIVIQLHHRHSFSKEPPLSDLSAKEDVSSSSFVELPRGLQPRESVKETRKKLNVSESILTKYQTRTVQTKTMMTSLERLSTRLQASQQYVTNSLTTYCQMLGMTEQSALYWQEKMNWTPLSCETTY